MPLDHPQPGESSYAITKTTGESYVAMSGLDWVSFRLANIYGPRVVAGPAPTFYTRLSEGPARASWSTRAATRPT